MAKPHKEIRQGPAALRATVPRTLKLTAYLFSFGGIQAMGILQEFPLSM
jgi:hypothetical protein